MKRAMEMPCAKDYSACKFYMGAFWFAFIVIFTFTCIEVGPEENFSFLNQSIQILEHKLSIELSKKWP